MKIVFCLSVFLTFVFSSISLAQTVETQPEFPGGEEEMMKFIRDNVEYPEEAIEKNEQGRIYVQFVVEMDGELTDIKVVRGASPLLDKEAVRVISRMPKWTPGTLNGKKVRVRYTVPINFVLG